tara:strand:- start:8539 stop:8712 length:174 start_codon:yes stop_codon:yes gene_type:complete
MIEKIRNAIPWFLTAGAALFQGIWAIVGSPNWWGTLIALVVAATGVLLGKPWKPPTE